MDGRPGLYRRERSERRSEGAGVSEASGETAGRLAWVDVARGSGIVLVIVGHALGGLIDSPLGRGFGAGRSLFFAIYTFHMPLFLLLSGLLVADRLARDPRRFRARLWSGLAWPYFLWSAVQLTVIAALGTWVNQPLGDYLGSLASLPWHTVSQFWFLYALFVLHLLALVLLPGLGRNGFLLFCLALKPLAPTFPLPEVLHLTANQALFYGIGLWLGPRGLAGLATERPIAGKLALTALAGLLVALALSAADSLDPTRQLASAKAAAIANVAWRYEVLPAALAGALGTVALASLLRGRAAGVLVFLGQRTMPIFVLHIMAIAGTRIALARFAHLAEPWPVFAASVALGLALPLLADAILRRLGLTRWLGLA